MSTKRDKTPADRLAELRAAIQRERPYIGKKPYSHNIVRLTLAIIEKEFGRAAANETVRKYKLEAKGFNEEPINDEEK